MTRCRRSRQVAWNAGIASGFFCVTGARHLKLTPEACAHEAIERRILDRHPVRLPDPLAQRLIRGEAFRATEGLLEAGEHLGREGDGFAGRHIGGQQSVQAPRGLEGQPAADRMAVHPQQMRHVLAGLGLPTGQQIEHLEAGLLMAIRLTLEPVLEISRMVGNPRYGCTQRRSSRAGVSLKSWRIPII
jgi:hypothetical protein